jgi:hypothetical protein
VEHFQCRAVVGTVTGFVYFTFNRKRQTAETVEKNDIVSAGAQSLGCRTLVVRLGDDDQRGVETLVTQRLQGGGRRTGNVVEAVQYRVPVLLAQQATYGSDAWRWRELGAADLTLPVIRQLLDHCLSTANNKQPQGGILAGGGGLHEFDQSNWSTQL